MKRIITAVTLILMLSGCSHMAEHKDLWKGAVSSILQLIGQNETEEAKTCIDAYDTREVERRHEG